jgi:hypothetical protein
MSTNLWTYIFSPPDRTDAIKSGQYFHKMWTYCSRSLRQPLPHLLNKFVQEKLEIFSTSVKDVASAKVGDTFSIYMINGNAVLQ